MTKTKLWRGKKRLAIKLGIKDSHHIEMMNWALSIKPGDYINTCGGCNRKVAKIEPRWVNQGRWNRGKPNRTWVLFEVEFTDTNGGFHVCPGGGCAGPKYSVEYLMQDVRNYYGNQENIENAKNNGWWGPISDKILEAVKSGQPIFDEFGEYLPEFDPSKVSS